MALIWEPKITAKCVAEYRIRFDATVTDDVSGKVYTLTIPDVIIETQAQQIAALDQMWNKLLEEIARESVVSTIIGDLEAAAKINLEAREI